MQPPFEYIVVLDFEATCKPGAPPVPQEIIELPSVLVSLRDRAVVDSFESFVRPVHHPVLDPFCTELTSIRQEDVDGAPSFVDVYAKHRAWLAGHGLLDVVADGKERFVVVTCGDWDLSTMLPAQCAASGIPITSLPRAYRQWCNIKTMFERSFKRGKGFGMPTMLAGLGLELEGRHHRGIDDCRNIARIALALAERGSIFDVTRRLSATQYPPLRVGLSKRGEQHEVILTKRLVPSLLGLASGTFRTQIVEARTADGALVTDEALLELAPGTTLEVFGPRDAASMG